LVEKGRLKMVVVANSAFDSVQLSLWSFVSKRIPQNLFHLLVLLPIRFSRQVGNLEEEMRTEMDSVRFSPEFFRKIE